MRSSLVAQAASGVEMQMPPLTYGIVAFTLLFILLRVTLAVRSVWTRRR